MQKSVEPSDPSIWALAYSISTAWQMSKGAVALYFGLPPLPEVRDAIGGWPGTLVAVVVGAMLFALVGAIHAWLTAFIQEWLESRKRISVHDDGEAPGRP